MFKEYVNYWKNLFNFRGRARRREYWVATLWNYAVMFLLVGILFCSIMSCVDFTTEAFTPKPIPIGIAVIVGLISAVYYVALMIGSLSLSIRRCHDIGYHWYVFLLCILGSLVCGIGAIVWFVFTCLDSKEDNEWGANPKSPENNQYDNASGIIASIVAYVLAMIIYVGMICFTTFGTLLGSGALKDAINGRTIETSTTIGTENSLYEGGNGYYSLSYNAENDYFSGMEVVVQDDKVINISLEHMPQ